MRVLSLIPKLLQRTQLAEILNSAEIEHKSFKSADELLEQAKLDPKAMVILDLNANSLETQTLIKELKNISKDIFVLAFFSHVEHEKEEEALTAGADKVLPRSKFFGKVLEIIAQQDSALNAR